jgi:hypothetical protein
MVFTHANDGGGSPPSPQTPASASRVELLGDDVWHADATIKMRTAISAGTMAR